MAECFWVVDSFFKNIVKRDISLNRFFKRNYFETKLGKYFITPDLVSTYIVSPTFERVDIEELLRRVGADLKSNKKVLFIDVGAYFGTYTVALGSTYRKYSKNFDIIAFEPEASNFFDNNFEILKKNIKVNKLSNVTLHKIGLGSENTKKLNKYGIATKKLDSVINPKLAKKYDAVYMKIDIEGFEVDALKGAVEFIKNCQSCTLLIEDYVDTRLIPYLERHFQFIDKVAPHNTLWGKK